MNLDEVQINNFLNMVFRDYVLETNEDKIIADKFKTILSCNIYEDRKKYADDDELKNINKLTDTEINKINNLNGLTVLPNKINSNFTIIINMKQVNETYDFIYTFAHELTHVCDFSKHMDHYNILTANELLSSKYYFPIYYWSEFHARYYTYKYARKYFKMSKKDILKAISENEFTYNIANLKNCMKNNKNGGVEILTELMYQYGRFIAYKEYGFYAIEQAIFPKEIVKDMFGDAGISIYYLFENISTYKDFKDNYTQVTDILEEIRVNFDNFRYRYNQM